MIKVRRRDEAPRPDGGIVRTAWLADSVLLVLATDGAREEPPDDALEAVTFFDVPDNADGVTAVWAVNAAPTELDGELQTFAAGGRAFTASTADLRDALTDLPSLLHEHLARWDAVARTRLLAFLAEVAHAFGDRPLLAEGLAGARAALRERLPLSVADESPAMAVAVDGMCAVEPGAFFVHGWIRDATSPAMRLSAVSPLGERVELAPVAARFRRDEVAERLGFDAHEREWARPGFACLFETRAGTPAGGWTLELETGDGSAVETPEVVPSTSTEAARGMVLAALRDAGEQMDEPLERHAGTALERIHAALVRRAGIGMLATYGKEPQEPPVSLIVMLGARAESMEDRVVAFADDPALHGCDVTFVASSPDEGARARSRARELHDLYAMPFRVATPTEPVGPALARRLGASVARAPLLLFVGEGVTPTSAGWLTTMTRFLYATPGAGALAPKLVDADGAIVHAGWSFETDDVSPRPRFEGRLAGHATANVVRPLAAVAADCMLVPADDYASAGGFAGGYLDDRYEACDLGLRLASSGQPCWYLPAVSMFRSREGDGAAETTAAAEAYDRRLLGHRRGEELEAALAACTVGRREA